MFSRRSLSLPITLAVGMIVLLVGLTVGWIVLTVSGMVGDQERSALFVALLSVGTVCLTMVLLGTVMYLVLSIKAINLSRRQSNFIDSVTHELKSPIASLKLYLQTLTRRSLSQEERRDFYGVMLDDVERLDSLISHLLDAARLEKSLLTQDTEQVDLGELLAECAHSVCLRHHMPKSTVRLELTSCHITMRRVDLDMVFRNLLDNAVKYAGTPPEVEVSLQRLADGKALVTVSDNGDGIPRKLRRKIFGRFVRLGSELERQKPGTGLGLYIVRTLVNRQKGKIQVRDRVGGTGTVFEVELPGARAFPQHGARDELDNQSGQPEPIVETT